MNCYICGQSLTELKIDPRDQKPRPCSHCEEVIKEAVSEFSEGATDLDYLLSPDPVEEIQDGLFRGVSRAIE